MRGQHEPEVSVRAATPSDLEALVAFNAAMARETEGRTLDRDRLSAGTRAVFDDGARGFYVVAEQAWAGARQVCGCLLITREWSDWRNGWFWWIQSVYVAPAARRRGVYRAMYRWVQQAARGTDPRDGAPVVGLRLYVEHENRSAMATYAALGMTPARYQLFEVDSVLGSSTP